MKTTESKTENRWICWVEDDGALATLAPGTERPRYWPGGYWLEDAAQELGVPAIYFWRYGADGNTLEPCYAIKEEEES